MIYSFAVKNMKTFFDSEVPDLEYIDNFRQMISVPHLNLTSFFEENDLGKLYTKTIEQITPRLPLKDVSSNQYYQELNTTNYKKHTGRSSASRWEGMQIYNKSTHFVFGGEDTGAVLESKNFSFAIDFFKKSYNRSYKEGQA